VERLILSYFENKKSIPSTPAIYKTKPITMGFFVVSLFKIPKKSLKSVLDFDF